MTKKDFCDAINVILSQVTCEMSGDALESINMWNGTRLPSVFHYSATSERCMERQLAELKGCERRTTFMADLSIGEWCGGWNGVADTVRRSMKNWRDDVEMMSEFVLCVNWKAWEHHARGNMMWAKLYSLLCDGVSDLMFRYYEGDDEKTSYLWRYLD